MDDKELMICLMEKCFELEKELEILWGVVRFVQPKPCNHAGFTRFEN